jgi:ATP/ADP translocase
VQNQGCRILSGFAPYPFPVIRFYPLFGQLSSIAPIIAGQCVARLSKCESFATSLHLLTLLVTGCGVGIFGLYRYCTIMVRRDAEAG